MKHNHQQDDETTLADECRKLRRNRELQPATFVPLGNLIFLQVFKQDTSKGGVVLPDTLQESSYPETPLGLVIAVGPDTVAIRRGDVVLVPAHMPATKVQHRGVEGIILNEGNIMGVIRPRADDPSLLEELPNTCEVLEQRKARALGGEVY